MEDEMASINIDWGGVTVVLSEAETKSLENAEDLISAVGGLLGLATVGAVILFAPVVLIVGKVALGGRRYIQVNKALVENIDQGYGVSLTLPWAAIWFDMYWLIVPTPNPPPPDTNKPTVSAGASLGGQITSPPIAVANFDGRLEAFARGTDNSLWHIWQSSPGGGWSSWANLGGGLAGEPCAARNADGRLEAFARGTDNALWHISQNTPGGGWSSWVNLGGGLAGEPYAARNADGRLEAFARGTDNALWHISQNTPGGGWSSWASLAGELGADPIVVLNAGGAFEAFSCGTDGALWHIWQVPGGAGGWSQWANLGGGLQGVPAIGMNADGRLEVFIWGTDNALWHIWQTTPGSGSWSSWVSLGMPPSFLWAGSTGLASSPAVTSNRDGRLEVFVDGPSIGSTRMMWHMWQTSPGGGWSGWSVLPTGVSAASPPSVAVNSDGRLEAFVQNADETLWHTWQSTPGGSWV